MSKLEAFLAGERLEDVALFLPEENLDAEGRLTDLGHPVEGGVVLVVDGETGRSVFNAGTGLDLMDFARAAMTVDGYVERDLTGGDPPDDGDGVEFVFAFAEAENEEVGDIYAEGDVIHAYAKSTGGAAFSDRWVVGREDETWTQRDEPADA